MKSVSEIDGDIYLVKYSHMKQLSKPIVYI